MSKTFRRIVLCSTDDFVASKNEKIRGWVESNGGKFTKEMTSDVTHLVSSKKAWKADIPIVRAARRQKTVKIISLSWLEDSLLSTNRKPLPTDKYDRLQRHWRKRKAEKAHAQGDNTHELHLSADIKKQGDKAAKDKSIEEAGKAFDQACRDFEVKVKADGYHLYTDSKHFVYSVNLVRKDIHANRLEKHRLKVRYAPFFSPFTSPFNTPPCPLPLYYFPEPYPFSSNPTIYAHLPRHLRPSNHKLRIRVPDPWANCLQLYESDKTPHLYASFSTFLNHTGRVHHDIVAPKGSTFELAKDSFKMFFKLRTGVEWESNPIAMACKREQSAGRERGISQDGAGDFVYHPEEKVADWKEYARRPSVTMVVNDEDAGAKIDARAKTPEGGW